MRAPSWAPPRTRVSCSCVTRRKLCYTEKAVLHGESCVTRRKLQTPGTAEEHNRQETPTFNPIDHQLQLCQRLRTGSATQRLCRPGPHGLVPLFSPRVNAALHKHSSGCVGVCLHCNFVWCIDSNRVCPCNVYQQVGVVWLWGVSENHHHACGQVAGKASGHCCCCSWAGWLVGWWAGGLVG